MSSLYPDPFITSIKVFDELPFDLKQRLTPSLVDTIMETEHNVIASICEKSKYSEFIKCPVILNYNALILPKLKMEISNKNILINEKELLDLIKNWKTIHFEGFDLLEDCLEDDCFKTNFEQWLN